MNNEIYIRRQNKIILVPVKTKRRNPDKAPLATVLKNIERLGYTFSKDVIEVLSYYSSSKLHKLYKEILPTLKRLKGDHILHRPMYPDFPSQVMGADEAELYINALLHYFGDWIGVRILPEYEVSPRPSLLENTRLQVIGLGSEEEFKSIFTSLVGANTSISETDKEDLGWFLQFYKERILPSLPERIPQRENLAVLTASVIDFVPSHIPKIFTLYRTPTDVLRLAVSMSGGDVSLASNTKFRSFSRYHRRVLLSLLESTLGSEIEMFSHRGKWLRLGERLHPGETKHRKKFPKALKAFDRLRENKPSERSFNAKVESLLEQNKIQKVATLLSSNPGYFTRRLDQLTRKAKTAKTANAVVNKFSKVVNEVATPVLLQVSSHFRTRNGQTLRTFLPKGSLAKAFVVEGERPELDQQLCERISNICEQELVERWKKLPKLGKIYVDSSLKDFTVPFSQRSSSKALRTVSRGSKFDLGDKGTVRFFLYWKQAELNRTDIDLSAVMFSEDWNLVEQVSYTNLRSSKLNACHSGDITSAPDGASEFIDLDIKYALGKGARYITMNVYSFTGQTFCDIPECFAGWMTREEVNSGEIYDPKTVDNKIDLANEGTASIPLVLDLLERKVIWVDLALKSANSVWANNVHGSLNTVTLLTKSFVELKKPDLYTLFRLHGEARGQLVYSPEEADNVFSVDEGITPYDIEEIISEYLM